LNVLVGSAPTVLELVLAWQIVLEMATVLRKTTSLALKLPSPWLGACLAMTEESTVENVSGI